MKLEFYAPLWGSDHMPFEAFLDKACENGFSGVEMPFPREFLSESERVKRVHLIKSRGLKLITQHYETVTPDFTQYKKELKSRMLDILATEPICVNSQTGLDFFEFEQSLELIDLLDDMSQRSGIPIYHETHRGRFNFAAHVCAKFVKARPNILQTADFSHFCCVAGNLLELQQHNLEIILPTIRLIHSRVGFSEGPQVPDPKAPEYQPEVKTHLTWWLEILKQAKNRGCESFPITTEFGPPPYMPTIPFSQKPTTDQWSANLYIKQLITTRFNKVE